MGEGGGNYSNASVNESGCKGQRLKFIFPGHVGLSIEWSMTKCYTWIASARESLPKGKDQYGLPPCTSYFISAAFNTKIHTHTRQASLMRRSPVLSVSFQ